MNNVKKVREQYQLNGSGERFRSQMEGGKPQLLFSEDFWSFIDPAHTRKTVWKIGVRFPLTLPKDEKLKQLLAGWQKLYETLYFDAGDK